MKVPFRNKKQDLCGKNTNTGGYISDDIFSKDTNEKESKSNFFKTEENVNNLNVHTYDSTFMFKNKE